MDPEEAYWRVQAASVLGASEVSLHPADWIAYCTYVHGRALIARPGQATGKSLMINSDSSVPLGSLGIRVGATVAILDDYAQCKEIASQWPAANVQVDGSAGRARIRYAGLTLVGHIPGVPGRLPGVVLHSSQPHSYIKYDPNVAPLDAIHHPEIAWTAPQPLVYQSSGYLMRASWWCVIPDEATVARSVSLTAPTVDLVRYPHRCAKCGSPAYVGFSSVDCSKGC